MTTHTTETTDKLANARASALASFAAIKEMVGNLNRAREIEEGTFDWEEEAERLGFEARTDIESGEFDWEEVWFHRAKDVWHHDAETACRSVKEYPDEDDARQRINEDALSVQIRSGWYTPGETPEPEEFEILLSTGGPATRIIGELDESREPYRARLQCQDWFTPWTDVYIQDATDTLLDYARCFYYGE